MPGLIEDFITTDCPLGNAMILWCEGCRTHKVINLTDRGPIRDDQGRTPIWTWNGSRDRPTVRPSILTGNGTARQCHCWITDGMVEYLPDSRHNLTGQTVPMQPCHW